MAIAEMFDLSPTHELDARFAAILDELRTRTAEDALAFTDRYRRQLLALDAEVLAHQVAAGCGDRDLELLAGRGTTHTKSQAKTRADRARAVNENPALRDDLASGQLTSAGLDAIAAVAERSDGAAAHDQLLVERVKSAPPDRAVSIARDWLDEHTTPDEHEARYQHQRRRRSVRRFLTRDGLHAICAEGDREHIDEMWSVLSAESKLLFRQDGGRDLALSKHPRTHNQRLFDALHCAVTTSSNAGDPESQAPGVTAGSMPRRVQVFVTMTIDELVDGATKARLVGGGTIPQSLLHDYLAGDVRAAGVLFDGNGHVLWHGRSKRWATQPQLAALAARDEGCVLCNASPAQCDGHHIVPFNSPSAGRTDTDELALVCGDCHHHIHANQLTLQCQPDANSPGRLRWELRPASPDELPP